MQYIKGGQIFNPHENYDWMNAYGSPVTAVEFDSFIRIYFSTRSKPTPAGILTSHIGFIDCDKNDPSKILYIHDKPLLEVGQPGTFDEHGTMVAEVVQHDGKYYMYYMGWQRSETVPYVIRTGLATSKDGTNFTKISEGPVIGLNRFVPFGVGNISIVVEDGMFHMWYTHYEAWLKTPNGYRPNYDIRYAVSKNGLDWEYGERCITHAHDNESIATPTVCKLAGKYHMWYAYRPGIDESGKSGAYRIGYATSEDKKHWRRADDQISLTVSETGWDSQMICAPDILEVGSNLYLFYCGNAYGETGFGYARIER
jgi:predicted GH43/DUF377 family glycosyl hydrolase